MIFLDRKFLLLVSARLQQFKEKGQDLYQFRCPLCGDSRKNRLRARGYIYKAKEYDGYGYSCHNCNISTNFTSLLKHLDPLLYKEYVMEKFNSKASTPKVEPEPVNFKLDMRVEPEVPMALGLHNVDLPTMNDLPDDHYAKAYIMARKVPPENFDRIFFTEDFKKYMDEIFPDHGKKDLKPNDPRVIFFYTDRAGYITTVGGRAFTADHKQRYLKVKVVEYKKIYGLERLDLGKKIYLTEGEFDSMFLPNAVASGDSALVGAAEWLEKNFQVRPIIVYDKEPRNKEIVKGISSALDGGWDVCMLPETFPGKDINDAIKEGGLSLKEVQDIIDANIFSGLTGKLKLSSWKKT